MALPGAGNKAAGVSCIEKGAGAWTGVEGIPTGGIAVGKETLDEALRVAKETFGVAGIEKAATARTGEATPPADMAGVETLAAISEAAAAVAEALRLLKETKGAFGPNLDPLHLDVEGLEASFYVHSRVAVGYQAVDIVSDEGLLDGQLVLQCSHFGLGFQFELTESVCDFIDEFRCLILITDQVVYVGSESVEKGLDALRSRDFLGAGVVLRIARLDSLLGWL
ncbi:hypothetical protein PG984_005354 [Apiospora sp. TS-2023a]